MEQERVVRLLVDVAALIVEIAGGIGTSRAVGYRWDTGDKEHRLYVLVPADGARDLIGRDGKHAFHLRNVLRMRARREGITDLVDLDIVTDKDVHRDVRWIR